MLYDPKWEKTVKADQFTLESLIAWLEKQCADARYDFCEFSKCLLGEWTRSIDSGAHNAFDHGAPSGYFYIVSGQTIDLTKFMSIACGDGPMSRQSHTFGAALKRARALA